MRQQSSTASKKSLGKATTPAYLRTSLKPVMGDSIEVMEMYYRERIQSFNSMLEHLNVLDDAPEIEFLCREIIEGRTMLVNLAARKKYSA
ncbi:MAG: hypothetical protein ABIQ88_16130 [Chitinophagaceae bacterium]